MAVCSDTFELNNDAMTMRDGHGKVLAIPGNSRGLIMNRDAISEILVPCMRQRHTLPSGIVEGRVRSGRRISDVKQPYAVKVITDMLRARSQTKNKEDNKENAKSAHAISY